MLLLMLLLFPRGASFLRLPLFHRSLIAVMGGVLYTIGAAWLLMELVNVAAARLLRRARSNSLVLLGSRVTKVLILIVASASLLHRLGMDLASILAGLGIGGIAIALAAQKTLENFFGGLSVFLDKSVIVGDVCRVGDRLGVVEDIGARCTRLRTPAGTVLSVPNAALAAAQLENLSLHAERIWFKHELQLRNETAHAQVTSLLTRIRSILAAHPMVASEPLRVRLTSVGPPAPKIEILAYVKTVRFDRYLEVQEELLLRMMDAIEESYAASPPGPGAAAAGPATSVAGGGGG